jgi:5-methylcytosine-specific restriction endonuclease McrA
VTQTKTQLKRVRVKYVRDRAKSAYKKEKNCYVCGANTSLDLHHVHSISELFAKWCDTSGIQIKTVEDILEHRDQFISNHKTEIYEDVRTLCRICHSRLHKLFGQKPPLHTAKKQLIWLDKLRKKFYGNNTT